MFHNSIWSETTTCVLKLVLCWTLFENLAVMPPKKKVPKDKPTAPKMCCAICSNEVEKVQVAVCVECHKNKYDVCTEIERYVLYRRVNKRNWLRSAYCLLSACFFPGFATG